ncbi:MAG: BBP7 family outer membrane beta-barrel protein [Planctomycetes bacterium]|nr:BBP7 family outer membrane beta-barrel protein [Planctomycetota bacterium]
MRTFVTAVAALLVGSGALLAQQPGSIPRYLGPPAIEGEKKDAPPPRAGAGAFFTDAGTGTGSFWGNAEFLLWSFKSSPVGVPLVTTSNQADQGIIGNPSTQVLFGDRSVPHEWRNGYRLTVGGWIESEKRIGVEATGFYFANRTNTDFVGSTSSPSQILAIPFNNVSPTPFNGSPSGGIGTPFVAAKAGENAVLISGSNVQGVNRIGSILVTTSAGLWGGELNGLFNLIRTERTQVHALFGFRYMDLRETLNMYVQNDITNAAGAVLTPPNRQVTFYDHFGTRNQFYGGNIGLKGEWNSGIFFANAVAKIALGANHQSIDIDGAFSDPQPYFIRNYGAGKGGIFAETSNSGNTSRDRFCVVPEAQVNIGVNLTRNIKAFAGYDFVYLSSVVRPGDQIDRNINLTQNASGPNGSSATLIGQASPSLTPRSSSFYAHGANFGLMFAW